MRIDRAIAKNVFGEVSADNSLGFLTALKIDKINGLRLQWICSVYLKLHDELRLIYISY